MNPETQALREVAGIFQELRKLGENEASRQKLLSPYHHYAGRQYCLKLTEAHIPPRQSWQARGCPSTYAEAWKYAYWRKQLIEERARIRRRLCVAIPCESANLQESAHIS
jgi:hypothetical protein